MNNSMESMRLSGLAATTTVRSPPSVTLAFAAGRVNDKFTAAPELDELEELLEEELLELDELEELLELELEELLELELEEELEELELPGFVGSSIGPGPGSVPPPQATNTNIILM